MKNLNNSGNRCGSSPAIHVYQQLRFFLSFSIAADKMNQADGRLRRNSDSFLFLSPKEDEVTLMKLNQAENKWNFKMQILENEIDKLKTEVAVSVKKGRSATCAQGDVN